MSATLTWAAPIPPGVEEIALQAALEAAARHGGRADADFDVIFVSDEELTRLHDEYLDDLTPTDVMAFDLGSEGGGPAGELYVSVDCARRVAAERGVAVQRELALYVVHGCLHLCGFDDHEDGDRARMRAAERELLRELGYPDDEAPHELGSH